MSFSPLTIATLVVHLALGGILLYGWSLSRAHRQDPAMSLTSRVILWTMALALTLLEPRLGYNYKLKVPGVPVRIPELFVLGFLLLCLILYVRSDRKLLNRAAARPDHWGR